MKSALLTVDGAPVNSYQTRKNLRRKADVEIHEAKREHRLTLNALVAAIQMIESGQRSVDLLQALKASARRAEKATQ